MVIESALISSMATSAGKCVAEEGVKNISKKLSKLNTEIKTGFNILNEEITIICPENIQKCSIIFEPHLGLLFNKKKRFTGVKVRRATLRAIHSIGNYNSAINYLDDGFEIDLKKLPQDDIYILDVDYVIDDPNFLDSFIKRHKSNDIPFDDYTADGIRKYWMHAELKHPKTLRDSYGTFDFQDVDFKVDVAIHQDIKTDINPKFKAQIKRLCELVQETNPRAMLKKGHAYINSKKYSSTQTSDILADLQDIFTPNTFEHFVNVDHDFNYFDCKRGVDFHDNLPIPTWPKTMDVISRTDISLETPAVSGVLTYNRSKFIDEIIKITEV